MSSTKELLHQLANPNLSRSEQAQLRCELAKQLERAGNHEAARKAMGELWQRVGDRPLVEELDEESKGDVLLRAGTLTGWIGSTKQIEGAQEIAKNLISESIVTFEALQKKSRVAEAEIDLAYCYWREGAFDDARIILKTALSRLTDDDIELKARALLASSIVERAANRYNDALRIQIEAAALFQHLQNHSLQGTFHNTFANVLENLGRAEHRDDYIDRALIEYAAASYHFEQAGHQRYAACVENNLGFLFSSIGRFEDAHEHLDRAQILFTRLKDDVHLAQVDETRARVMLAERRLVDAEKAAHRAVRTLEKGDEQSLLAEALTTLGISLARLGHPERARSTLEQAIHLAGQAGDPEKAGHAALVMIEELIPHLSNDELCVIVERAETLLEKSRDVPKIERLAKSACRVLSLVHGFPMQPDWTTFDMKVVKHRQEAHFIELALKESGGSVTEAARLLGLAGHQSLLTMLRRHKELLKARKPIRSRRRSVIETPKGADSSRENAGRKIQTARVLHVEDDKTVAGIVKEMLENQGCQVETCADGNAALEKISGADEYDLLLVDYDLPGANGLEIINRARELDHRCDTPMVVLAASPVEAAAREAGADVFLQKPQDVSSLVETINRLLEEREQED